MKKYFSTEDREPVKTVKVIAIKRGTVTSPRGIFHVDPNGKDPLARARTVPVDIAEELKRKGLVKFEGRGSARTSGRPDGTPLHLAAANRRTTSVENDGEELRNAEYFGSSGADTRDTTAFSTDPSKFARTGVQSVEPTTDDDDTDLDIGSEGNGDEGEHDDDGTDPDAGEGEDEGAHPMDVATTDTILGQEGNAGGADAPPVDDGDDTDSAHTTATDHDGDNQTGEVVSTENTGTVADATTADAPAPRRGRGRAATVA